MENNLIKIFPDKKDVNKIIQEIFEEYDKDPLKILTESDLHCMTYKKLSEIIGDYVMLHSEIYWKNQNGKLRYRPDLSIISKKDINLYKDGKFKFEGKIGAVIFEFKFGLRGDLEILLSKIGENFKFITNYSAI